MIFMSCCTRYLVRAGSISWVCVSARRARATHLGGVSREDPSKPCCSSPTNFLGACTRDLEIFGKDWNVGAENPMYSFW